MRQYGPIRKLIKRKECKVRSLAYQLRDLLEQNQEIMDLLDLTVHETADEKKRTALCFIVGLSYYDEYRKGILEMDKRLLAKLYILAEGNPLFRLICLSRMLEEAVLSERYKDRSVLFRLGEQVVRETEMVDAQNLFNQSAAHLYEVMSRLCDFQKKRQYIKQGIACLNKISQNRPEAAFWCRQLNELIEEEAYGL